MEDRYTSDRRQRDRRHSRSPARVRDRVEDDRKSYRDRERRKEHAYTERREDQDRRNGHGHNTRSRSQSPYKERSYRRRSPSSSSSDDRKRRRNTHEDYNQRSKRRRPSPSISRSPPPRSRHTTRRSLSPPRRSKQPASPTCRSKHPLSPDRRGKRSPSPQNKRIEPFRRAAGPLPSQQAAYTADPTSTSAALTKVSPAPEKQKPNFAPSGALAAETNTVAGTTIVLKYNEPPEARKPPASQSWRLYVFKGSETIDTLPLAERSCWLFGRERSVVDYAIEHPSCSKQHAVVQFRFVEKKNEFGDKQGGVRPYVIDLDSANGTKVNGKKVPERRYVELMSGDVLAYGDSTREYVLILPPKE